MVRSITSAPGVSGNEIQMPEPSAKKDSDSEPSDEESENVDEIFEYGDAEEIIFTPPSESTKKMCFHQSMNQEIIRK